MTHRIRIVASVLAATGLAAGCGAAHEPAAEPAAAPPALDGRTVPVQRVSWPRVLEAGGVVEARTTALLAARIVADVRAVLVEPGARVRAGQVLVRLDDRDAASQRTRAIASREAVTHARQAAEAERTAAMAALGLADATLKRIAQLHERKAATAQELDEAQAASAGARARLAAAEARVAEAGAALGAADAAAESAGVGVSYSTITAPFDGVVTEKLIEPGNQVAPGMPLLRIESPRHRADVTIDASRAAVLAPGTEVTVLVGEPPSPWTGRVAEIARAASAQSQSVRVKIDLPDGADVRSGQFARAQFVMGRGDTLVIPAASVRRSGQLTQVMIADDQAGVLRLVATGEQRGDLIAVLSGLSEGERVVVPGGGR